MPNAGVRAAEDRRYAWGPPCEEGLAIGLSVDGHEFDRAAPIPWRWALRDDGPEPRSVTVRADLDPSWRYRLQVFRAGAAQPLIEVPPRPREPVTTANISDTVVVEKGSATKFGPEQLVPGPAFEPGAYRLRLRFGGPDFRFDCLSGFIDIQVR